jgi:hypothetical protein
MVFLLTESKGVIAPIRTEAEEDWDGHTPTTHSHDGVSLKAEKKRVALALLTPAAAQE